MKSQHNPMDSAALAAGAIAAVLAVTGAEGPYDILGAVTGFVIVLVLIAYELPVVRTDSQNFAFACILSLSSLPILGFILEVIFSGWRGEIDFHSFFDGRKMWSENLNTAVDESVIFFSWVLLSFIYWLWVRKASNSARDLANRETTSHAAPTDLVN